MVACLFDTCILIDYLNGVEAARPEVDSEGSVAISVVTWMEVMAGAPEAALETTRHFLRRFTLLPIDQDIAEAAVTIRRERRLKLPDALIAASAVVHGHVLVTRDEKAFGADGPGVRIPYQL